MDEADEEDDPLSGPQTFRHRYSLNGVTPRRISLRRQSSPGVPTHPSHRATVQASAMHNATKPPDIITTSLEYDNENDEEHYDPEIGTYAHKQSHLEHGDSLTLSPIPISPRASVSMFERDIDLDFEADNSSHSHTSGSYDFLHSDTPRFDFAATPTRTHTNSLPDEEFHSYPDPETDVAEVTSSEFESPDTNIHVLHSPRTPLNSPRRYRLKQRHDPDSSFDFAHKQESFERIDLDEHEAGFTEHGAGMCKHAVGKVWKRNKSQSGQIESFGGTRRKKWSHKKRSGFEVETKAETNSHPNHAHSDDGYLLGQQAQRSSERRKNIQDLDQDAMGRVSEFSTVDEICKRSAVSRHFYSSRAAQLRRVKVAHLPQRQSTPRDLEIIRTLYEFCPNLEGIVVHRNYDWKEIPKEELAQLFNRCRKLRVFVGWTPAGVLCLVDAPELQLNKLCMDLSEPDDMPALVSKCTHLQELIIRKGNVSRVSQACLEELSHIGTNIKSLVSLSIRNIPLTAQIKNRICEFKHILHLEIIAGDITDADLLLIGANLSGLLELGLCGNSISFEGIRHLARTLHGLRALDIMATLADSRRDVCEFLSQDWVFPKLTALYVRLWETSWRTRLHTAKPKCKVIDFEEWKRTTN